ncbi:MAG: DUF4832 domain-containing protein [Kiritimatiellae bacterium]|nr:DUF4832 domain-containing protein [Kiritimatiellia bacterium]
MCLFRSHRPPKVVPPDIALLIAVAVHTAASAEWVTLPYAPAPPDNPMKGLVPYAGHAQDFPHSLEFQYFGLNEILRGPDEFDWTPIERFLEGAASRRCQAIFRVWVEYPGRSSGVPDFLLRAGARMHVWSNALFSDGRTMWTPDYSDLRIRAAITSTVAALGRRYDKDPRVAYLTAGFLGHWGEWHTHPRRDLWASKEVQTELMAAFERAFRHVPVLLRYPAGADDPQYAPNHDRPFGYHDDSFAYATRQTGRCDDEWFFLARLRRAGPSALERWRTHPIGGEIRPEVWVKVWDLPPGTPPGQEFFECVAETHATWLMDSSIARPLTAQQRARAIEGARRLGYELHVERAALALDAAGRLQVAIAVRNRGVAPWYADWPVELGIFSDAAEPLKVWRTDWTLRGIQPDEPDARQFRFQTDQPLPAGVQFAALRVPHPMPGGRPLRFANQAQDADRPGWLTLGPCPPPPPPR